MQGRSEIVSGRTELFSWVLLRPRLRKSKFGRFCGFDGGLGCVKRDVVIGSNGKSVADCQKSLIFDRREKKNEIAAVSDRQKSAVHSKVITINMICCAFTTSGQCHTEPTIGFGMYITYRAIHDIGLYTTCIYTVAVLHP